MLRRILLFIPVFILFLATCLVFLAARAPRTWASHWTVPKQVAKGAGEDEYGAVPDGKSWDLLWDDDTHFRIVFTPAHGTPQTLDRGDVSQPTLLRQGRYLEAFWIHDYNGSSALRGALIAPTRRIFTVFRSSQPVEHPSLFVGPHGTEGLVFSWQGHGNFDIYLMLFHPGSEQSFLFRRLTHARYYSFYPRAATDAHGIIHLIHLENCCRQQVWNVEYDLLNAEGDRIAPTRIIYSMGGIGDSSPSQWAMDMRPDLRGGVLGGFAGDEELYVFQDDGHLSRLVPAAALSDLPLSLATLPTKSGAYIFWDEPFDLGRYLDSRRFDRSLNPAGPPERAVYESATQSEIHAALINGDPVVIWQSVTSGLVSHFEQARYERDVRPTLGERFGLLGDPWQELGVLLVSAAGVAILTTMGNIITIFGLALVGLLALRVLRPIPGKWLLFSLLLAAALYGIFVAPGGPILFLSTLPSMGINPTPLGVLAAVGALILLLWVGLVAMKRMDDVYRAGAMAVIGVYFFAFIEAMIFIQQRLAYI